jgi:hypothetical protein
LCLLAFLSFLVLVFASDDCRGAGCLCCLVVADSADSDSGESGASGAKRSWSTDSDDVHVGRISGSLNARDAKGVSSRGTMGAGTSAGGGQSKGSGAGAGAGAGAGKGVVAIASSRDGGRVAADWWASNGDSGSEADDKSVRDADCTWTLAQLWLRDCSALTAGDDISRCRCCVVVVLAIVLVIVIVVARVVLVVVIITWQHFQRKALRTPGSLLACYPAVWRVGQAARIETL